MLYFKVQNFFRKSPASITIKPILSKFDTLLLEILIALVLCICTAIVLVAYFFKNLMSNNSN